MPAQSPGIGVAYVVDLALHAGVKFRKADLPGILLLPALPQPTAKVVHITGFHSAVLRIHEKPEPGEAVQNWHDLHLAHRWHWLSDGQYQHISTLVAELGRLLGGWMKAT
jgi:hypothetical protein